MNRRPAAALCSASLAFLLLPTIEAAAAGIPDAFTQARTYAFAACVMERYADTPLAAEAGVWASGIIENGDLAYVEDSAAEVDLNVVATGGGEFVEVQGTGEGRPFSRAELTTLLDYGEKGCRELISYQKDILGGQLVWLVGREG